MLEHTSPAQAHQAPEPDEQDEQLLHNQQVLQNEAHRLVAELNLVEVLRAAGAVRLTGSSVLGLMVWRDIDLQISSPGLQIAQAFTLLNPLLTHPRVKQVRYLHQSEHFKEQGLDERYFFMISYQPEGQAEWKLDISFWLGQGVHPEPVQEAMEQQLTPATRLTILRIKQVWYQLPAYRSTVYSTDIYDAVLQHGVQTLAQFDDYLRARGKPSYQQASAAL